MNADELDKLQTLDIMQTFLNSTKKLYVGVEMVMHVFCVAAIKMSVESIKTFFRV